MAFTGGGGGCKDARTLAPNRMRVVFGRRILNARNPEKSSPNPHTCGSDQRACTCAVSAVLSAPFREIPRLINNATEPVSVYMSDSRSASLRPWRLGKLDRLKRLGAFFGSGGSPNMMLTQAACAGLSSNIKYHICVTYPR